MMRLVELSVELRRPLALKESLHRYRALCGVANTASLEAVVLHAVECSEAAVDAARTLAMESFHASAAAQSPITEDAGDAEGDGNELISEGTDDIVADEVADSDDRGNATDDDAQPAWGVEVPQTLLLEANGMLASRTRIERQLLAPTLMFAWEVFRMCLDILKNNIRVEKAYHEVAERALLFTAKFNRATEFRRLCDILRQHMAGLVRTIVRSPQSEIDQVHWPTVQRMIRIRFQQADQAMASGHWQEAYRTMDDLHELLRICTRGRSPEILAGYFERLATIFETTDNLLLHALALYKLYLVRQAAAEALQNQDPNQDADGQVPGPSSETPRDTAVRLLVATLSIPVKELSAHSKVMEVFADAATLTSFEQARQAKMLDLLQWPSAASAGSSEAWDRLISNPTKSWLIGQVISNGIEEACPEALRELLYEFIDPGLLRWKQAGKARLGTPQSLAAKAQRWFTSMHLDVGSEVAGVTGSGGVDGTGGDCTGAGAPSSKAGQSARASMMPLSRAIIAELLLRIAQYYDSFLLWELRSMVNFLPFVQVHAIVLEFLRAELVPFRLDFRKGVLYRFCRTIEQEELGDALCRIATRLQAAASTITQRASTADEHEIRILNAKEAAFPLERLEREQQRRVTQLEVLQSFLKQLDEVAQRMEREEQRQAQLEAARHAEEEKRRLAEEARRRELEAIRREMEEKEQAELRRLKAEMDARRRVGLSASGAAAGLALPSSVAGIESTAAGASLGTVGIGVDSVGGAGGPARSVWSRSGSGTAAVLSGARATSALPGVAVDSVPGIGAGAADGFTAVGTDALDHDGDRLSRQELLQQQQQERLQQRKMLEQKIFQLSRRMDYLDRALHEKQATHLDQVHKEMVRELIARRQSAATCRLRQLQEQFESDLARRARLESIFRDPLYQKAVDHIKEEARARALREWKPRQGNGSPNQQTPVDNVSAEETPAEQTPGRTAAAAAAAAEQQQQQQPRSDTGSNGVPASAYEAAAEHSPTATVPYPKQVPLAGTPTGNTVSATRSSGDNHSGPERPVPPAGETVSEREQQARHAPAPALAPVAPRSGIVTIVHAADKGLLGDQPFVTPSTATSAGIPAPKATGNEESSQRRGYVPPHLRRQQQAPQRLAANQEPEQRAGLGARAGPRRGFGFTDSNPRPSS
jgi:hypothetical protein